MMPSKYVPKQLEILFFPYNRDFCHVYVVAFGTVPYNLIRLRSVDECWGSLRMRRMHFIWNESNVVWFLKSVRELGYDD